MAFIRMQNNILSMQSTTTIFPTLDIFIADAYWWSCRKLMKLSNNSQYRKICAPKDTNHTWSWGKFCNLWEGMNSQCLTMKKWLWRIIKLKIEHFISSGKYTHSTSKISRKPNTICGMLFSWIKTSLNTSKFSVKCTNSSRDLALPSNCWSNISKANQNVRTSATN